MRRGSGKGVAAAAVVVSSMVARGRADASVSQTLAEEAQTEDPGDVRANAWVQATSDAVDNALFLIAGVAPRLELAGGFLWGRERSDDATRWGMGAPTAQLKGSIVRPTREGRPGLALAIAARAPWGTQGFEGDEGWVGAAYLVGTHNVGRDRLVWHANAGAVRASSDGSVRPLVGVGASVKLPWQLRAVAELFHNDSSLAQRGGLAQGGLRWVASDHVNVDAFVGAGVWGSEREPAWVIVALKLDTASQ